MSRHERSPLAARLQRKDARLPPANAGPRVDNQGLLSALHHQVTSELLRLLDGFYLNIEDGLFELAYRTEEEAQRRRCFDLMRELRFRRAALVKNFARAMDRNRDLWHGEVRADAESSIDRELESLVLRMAERSNAHFSGLLGVIAARAESAGTRRFDTVSDLPISPRRVAVAFVVSCRSLRFDHAAIQIVQELFSRFVLDGLGNVYGAFNLRLEEEGFLTAAEMAFATSAS